MKTDRRYRLVVITTSLLVMLGCSETSGSPDAATRVDAFVLLDGAMDTEDAATGDDASTLDPDAGTPATWAGFEPPTGYPMGMLARDIASGDFDGDGDGDIAVTDIGAPEEVAVLLAGPTGTLEAPVSYATDHGAEGVVAADLNGDGNLDLAVGCSGGVVSFLVGNGDGTFAGSVGIATEDELVDLVAVDVDGDDDLDLVSAHSSPSAVNVLLNDGTGVFAAGVSYPAGPLSSSIAAGDLDGDGDEDLLVGDEFSGVAVLLNAGDGTFPDSPELYGTSALDITVGDFDQDGALDAAVADRPGDRVDVLLGDGDGALGAQTTFDVQDGPVQIVAGDFDVDGTTDLAVTNIDATSVSVLVGDGTGTFSDAASQLVACGNPWGITATDLDADTFPEIVVADGCALGQISVFHNRGLR